MTGATLTVLIIAFLPALIPLFYGRLGASTGVAALCVCSFFALTLLIVPGVVLWFVALILGVWSANNARGDRQHTEMMGAVSRPLVDLQTESAASRYVRPYKPAFSMRHGYEANIDGQRRTFGSKTEALAYVASQLGTTSQAPSIAPPHLPDYRGIPYQILPDYRVTSMGQKFESIDAFRNWVEAMPTTLTGTR